MKFLDSLRFRLATLFHRSEINTEVEEELLSHIQLRADDLQRSGLDRAEAERQARIEFGGHERFREECHEALGSNFIDTVLQDIRFSLRLLWKSPSFTIVAVFTLALAIGANAVVFGVLNGMILHPLNLPQAESLYQVVHGHDVGGGQSYPNYVDLRDRNRTFDGLAGFNFVTAALDTGKNPSMVWGGEVTGNYFDVLRVQPYLGRFFHSSDEHGPNSAPYVVLSYSYWHNHFQDDLTVIGRVVQVDKHPFTILGVTPPEFHGTLLFFFPEIWLPSVNQEQLDGVNLLNARGTTWVFMVIGHTKPGVTPAQAISDLNAIGADLGKTYPSEAGKLTFHLSRPSLYGDYMGGPVKAFLTGLMLLSGLILLAACANLGSLFAARAADRSREVALRLALGSSRRRILRQLFTEAVLISLMGGTVGLLGSIGLLRALSVWQPMPRYPMHVPVNPDANVYGMALLLALVSGVLFGVVPVRQVLRANPYEVVKAGHSGAVGRRITPRDVMLVVQITICAVLVTASLVAVRGLIRTLHSNFGFEPRNALLVDTTLSMAGYTGDAVAPMQKRIIDTLQAVPGVKSAAVIDILPLIGDWHDANVFSDQETDFKPSNAIALSVQSKVTPDYFRAAGTAFLEGRDFTWHDDKNAPSVAIINREFARKIYGSVGNAIGGSFKITGSRVQVVGVVEDGKYGNLTEDPQPAMFLSMLQFPSNLSWFVVRSDRDPQQTAAAIDSSLRNLDAALPFGLQTWNQELDIALFAPRIATVSLGVLGILGAMLSVTGIFGMAAYSVSKRLRELGIRIALGAQRKEVLQAALGRAIKLLAVGSAAGILLGILASRVLAHMVYEASPRDPLVLTGVVLAMLLLGLFATWIPAQRALSIDPLRLLREE